MLVTKTHVLVVEDDRVLRDLLALRLRARGFDVSTAAAVPDAIDVLEHGNVDAVVSDHDLPGATGLALLAYVQCRQPSVPFILTSGVVEPELRARAIANGADAVYEKSHLLDLVAA
jgi:CheY-like chemotaxis protein